jgi:hypothetical protein
MSGGRIALLVAGVLLALTGLGIAISGGAVLWVHGTQRNADGFVTSPTYELATDGYALTAERIDLGAARRGDWVPWFQEFDVQFDVSPGGQDELFVGIARADDIDGYLDGVAHAEVASLGRGSADVRYRERAGGPPAVPGSQDFWVASTEGQGRQDLRWRLESGTWAVVIMNADASPGVAVDAEAGARVGFLLPLGLTMLIGGMLLLAAGTVMIVVATAGGVGPREEQPGAGTAPAGATGAVATGAGGEAPPGGRAYPAVLVGHPDERLSRWLWLVKWLLVIPHVVVLAFLWLAFSVLTVVAGFAILFTGRYPRGIFDFNVGVVRWTWRVGFYSYSALGTDRYPPFSLTAADYPATFDVAYPERLSRGLVLVKWWLLAIPHYLVVAVFAGGALSWSYRPTGAEDWQWAFGGGLIGLLVLVAGVVLLFTGRYPAGLFDFVMGLNRWVYRVIAYATLMTDAYPPFRIDPGPDDPGTVPERPRGGAPTGARAPTPTSQ